MVNKWNMSLARWCADTCALIRRRPCLILVFLMKIGLSSLILDASKITVCSLCLHHKDIVPELELSSLIHQFPKPVIFWGGFNSRRILLSSAHNNIRGMEIEAFLLANDITLLNFEKVTHYNNHNGSGACMMYMFSAVLRRHQSDWEGIKKMRAQRKNSKMQFFIFCLAFICWVGKD